MGGRLYLGMRVIQPNDLYDIYTWFVYIHYKWNKLYTIYILSVTLYEDAQAEVGVLGLMGWGVIKRGIQ